mmetsp:Transcript_93569/g.209518  ORF Transcript_93569/g.209518 Transcript_93569/m.209518 type:complete len:240 (-) Transcript_93569:1017-1736(-)
MVRVRSWMPLHFLLHSDHSDQLDSLQLRATTQDGRFSQTWYSSRKPLNALPHSLASCLTSRRRLRKPLLHEAEHGDQSYHSPHAASLQSCSQVSELQGTASSMVLSSQSAPPFLGAMATKRLRRFTPPPHDTVHADQSYHSLHWQSEMSQAAPWHGEISSNDSLQPEPPSSAVLITLRLRVFDPWPQAGWQLDHSSHSPTSQSPGGFAHAGLSQALASRRLEASQLPPSLMGFFKKRDR